MQLKKDHFRIKTVDLEFQISTSDSTGNQSKLVLREVEELPEERRSLTIWVSDVTMYQPTWPRREAVDGARPKMKKECE